MTDYEGDQPNPVVRPDPGVSVEDAASASAIDEAQRNRMLTSRFANRRAVANRELRRTARSERILRAAARGRGGAGQHQQSDYELPLHLPGSWAQDGSASRLRPSRRQSRPRETFRNTRPVKWLAARVGVSPREPDASERRRFHVRANVALVERRHVHVLDDRLDSWRVAPEYSVAE